LILTIEVLPDLTRLVKSGQVRSGQVRNSAAT